MTSNAFTMRRMLNAAYPSLFTIIVMMLAFGGNPSIVNGFVFLRCDNFDRYQNQQRSHKFHMILNNDKTRESCNPLTNNVSSPRRSLFNAILIGIGVTTTSTLNGPAEAIEQPKPDDIIWMTGKMPIIPGQKPKDKSDVTGTRKDPSFLRSLSDCKNQCENMTGASSNSGYAKGKEECLSECQDICCTTYQQCTFPIVQRI
jgi:hypothetical protein